MSHPAHQIKVEIAYATPERQLVITRAIARGTTARQAAIDSGIEKRFSDLRASTCSLGIWGEPVDDEHCLEDGDRLECYRPLSFDPREQRRLLAEKGMTMGSSRSEPGDD